MMDTHWAFCPGGNIFMVGDLCLLMFFFLSEITIQTPGMPCCKSSSETLEKYMITVISKSNKRQTVQRNVRAQERELSWKLSNTCYLT